MKTCVLCLSRRNALECKIRSRSRWNGVRSGESSSATARRAGYERAASGDSWVRSNASMRSWKERSAGVVWETVTEGFSQADRRRDGCSVEGSALVGVAPLLTPAALVLHRRDAQPEAEADDRHQVDDRLRPVPRVCDRNRRHQTFACDRSQRASDVNPTITPSIQYCERTASCVSLYMTSARSCARTSAATWPTTTKPTCQYQVAVAPITP